MAEFSHWTRGRCMKTCTFKWNIHLVWLLINSGRLWWIHIYITTQKKLFYITSKCEQAYHWCGHSITCMFECEHSSGNLSPILMFIKNMVNDLTWNSYSLNHLIQIYCLTFINYFRRDNFYYVVLFHCIWRIWCAFLHMKGLRIEQSNIGSLSDRLIPYYENHQLFQAWWLLVRFQHKRYTIHEISFLMSNKLKLS